MNGLKSRGQKLAKVAAISGFLQVIESKQHTQPKQFTDMKKISALLLTCCSLTAVTQAQTVIDPLTGTGGPSGGYTTTLVLDNSHGVSGASYTTGASGLSLNFTGSTSAAEQSLSLASVGSFGSTFAVGDTLSVNVAVPASSILEDFGIAVAATTTPTAASASNPTAWDSRTLTDFAEISLRPSQNAVRGADSISGIFTSSFAAGVGSTANINQIFIKWVSADVFTLGYVQGATSVNLYTATFNVSSTIGAAIGFYGDIRATGTSLGTLSNLTSTPAPEPSTVAMCGLGFAGLLAAKRWKK